MSRARPSFGQLDVSQIYFTHARVRPFFSGCGRRLEDTLNLISCGDMLLDKLPQITVLYNTMSDGEVYYFSLNNRRLWVLKELFTRGYFEGKLLAVRLKEALPRERERYTIERCSLTAKIMKEGPSSSLDTAGPDGADSEHEVEGGEEAGVNKVAGGVGSDFKAASMAPGYDKTAGITSSEKERAHVDSASSKPVILQTRSTAALMTLSDKVTKAARELSAVWKKGKKGEQRVRSTVDEWIDAGVIDASQEAQVLALIK